MPTLDDVYRKFGETSEAAQLLETELGNLLLLHSTVGARLLEKPDSTKATEILTFVNRQTLGQLLKSINRSTDFLDDLEFTLTDALKARNRLSHSFYREHNFRRNSEDGRLLMMNDLQSIHEILLKAYKAVLVLSGVDSQKISNGESPTHHLPL